MAGTTFTSQNAAMAIPKIVAARALPALVGKLVMGNLVNRDFEASLSASGDTVNVPIPPVMTANNIAEAGTVTPQAPNLGNAQIVLNTHAESSFTLPDAAKVIAQPDLMDIYLEPALIAVAEKIETDLLSLYSNFTVNSVVGGNSAMDEARIELAETALFNQKVPQGSPKFLIVSGSAYSQMRQLPRFTDWEKLGPQGQPSATITGMLPGGVAEGRIKDFLVFRSQFIPKVSSITRNLAFGRDGIGLAMRALPIPLPGTGAIAEFVNKNGYGLRIVMSYQSNSLAQQFTVDTFYGCGVLRNSFGVEVYTN